MIQTFFWWIKPEVFKWSIFIISPNYPVLTLNLTGYHFNAQLLSRPQVSQIPKFVHFNESLYLPTLKTPSLTSSLQTAFLHHPHKMKSFTYISKLKMYIVIYSVLTGYCVIVCTLSALFIFSDYYV